MDTVEVFNAQRSRLFAIAYRMLGSAADAEDMVQEAFLRWHRVAADTVQSPEAYLATIITRLCIDHMESARVRRETYVGPWLPEPVLTHEVSDTVELADSLSIAFLVLLESLSPVERAAYLLREIFDYEYAEIAQIVGKSEANCRQMVSRAHERVTHRRPRFPVSHEQQERITGQFMQACKDGDMQGLLSLLTEDIVMYGDGGGKVHAALNPVYGQANVVRFLLAILRKAPPDTILELQEVNGQPAFVGYIGGELYNVLVLDIAEDHIRGLYNILNPDKLQYIKQELPS